MVMPPAGDVSYLSARPQDPAGAVRRMQPPSEEAAALMANHGIVPGSLAAAPPIAAPSPAPTTTTAPAATATPTPTAAPAPVSTPAPAAAAPPTTTSQTPATGGAVAGQG
jgi:hypothetical protein